MQVAKLLHLGITMSQQKLPGNSPQPPGQGVGRFLLPLEECEFALETAIDELQVGDPKTGGNTHSLE